jgi:hypothetical protein
VLDHVDHNDCLVGATEILIRFEVATPVLNIRAIEIPRESGILIQASEPTIPFPLKGK